MRLIGRDIPFPAGSKLPRLLKQVPRQIIATRPDKPFCKIPQERILLPAREQLYRSLDFAKRTHPAKIPRE
jgi:hypothetical protein